MTNDTSTYSGLEEVVSQLVVTDLDAARQHTEIWRARAGLEKDTLQLARVDLFEGILYRRRGEFVVAADLLMRGIERSSPTANPETWAYLNNELGTVYARLFMHAESIERFHNALAVCESNRDIYNCQYAYYQLYERYTFPDPDSARYYMARFEETLRILPLDDVRAAEVAIMRGRELFFQDSLREAIAIFKSVVADSRLRNDFTSEAGALQELAFAQINLNRVTEARATVDRIFAISEEKDIAYHRCYGLGAKYVLDTMSNRWEEALNAYSQMVDLNYQLIYGKNRQQIVELKNKFATKEQLQTINTVRQENLLYATQNENQTRHAIFLCVFAALLAILAGGGWWQYRGPQISKVKQAMERSRICDTQDWIANNLWQQ